MEKVAIEVPTGNESFSGTAFEEIRKIAQEARIVIDCDGRGNSSDHKPLASIKDLPPSKAE